MTTKSATTPNIPTHTPALKMSPIAAQPERNRMTAEKTPTAMIRAGEGASRDDVDKRSWRMDSADEDFMATSEKLSREECSARTTLRLDVFEAQSAAWARGAV